MAPRSTDSFTVRTRRNASAPPLLLLVRGELRLYHEKPVLPRPQRSARGGVFPGPLGATGPRLLGATKEEEGRRRLLWGQESQRLEIMRRLESSRIRIRVDQNHLSKCVFFLFFLWLRLLPDWPTPEEWFNQGECFLFRILSDLLAWG